MRCPVDESELVMTERQGVEIDYCPKCRGVWLDRGELDKIVERGSTLSRRDDDDDDRGDRRYEQGERYDEDHSYGRGQHPRKRKRKSFLGELFDFD
ncbi:MAG: zf-TFIIB domain-containing protein [Thermomicrobiales bacterium]